MAKQRDIEPTEDGKNVMAAAVAFLGLSTSGPSLTPR